MQKTSGQPVRLAEIRGRIVDDKGAPARGVSVLARGAGVDITTASNADGSYRLVDCRPGEYLLVIGKDQSSALTIVLQEQDITIIDWEMLALQSLAPLPLEEIRSVSITWEGGLVFRSESPWAQAKIRWMASGGNLVEQGETVEWQPPSQPGVYLLQLSADWGRAGVAVDAITLEIGDDGRITFG